MLRRAFLLSLFVACGGAPSGTPNLPTGPGNVGDPCMLDDACRMGLVCDATNKCAPGHKLMNGSPCVISSECADDLYCGPLRTCVPAGSQTEGSACSSDAECKHNKTDGYLRCNVIGFGGVCRAEGKVDQTQACTQNSDCFAALGCWKKTCGSLVETCKTDADCRVKAPNTCSNGLCRPALANPGFVPITIADFDGAACKDDMGAMTKAYFEVPRGTMADGDFYRLPFPNDIRLKNGKIDLTGHPVPGPGGIGADTVALYVNDVQTNADGFSTSPTIFFRFSANVDFPSLKMNNVVRLIDLTTGNDVGGHQWVANTAHNKYICDNWLALRPYFALTLVPGHTYAGLITTAALDAKMMPLARSDDMKAMVAATPPVDSALMAAYTAYAPLRTWATTKMFDPNTILVASVFTVGHPERIAARIPAAVAAAPAPTAINWVNCATGQSPCAQATGDRACGSADPAFDELQALVSLPVYQNAQGGVDVDGMSNPIQVRSDQICMSLAVPKGFAMPAQGWPLVVYAHDTERSYRSFVKDGIAKRLSTVDDGMGGQVHMAVLGIDQVQHGTRRALSDSASVLYLSDKSPVSARGNRLQGAIDQVSLLRFARGLDLTAMQSPNGNAIKFSRVVFWGHGQGAAEGALSIPYTDIPSIVMSGASAGMMSTMLGRKNPMATGIVSPFVAQDPMDESHPVMAIVQMALESVDPLVHASAMTFAPTGMLKPKHVFQPYAQKDSFTSSISQLAWAFGAALSVATPPTAVNPQDPALVAAGYKPIPLSGNFILQNQPYTNALREYPPGADGHGITTSDVTAMGDVDKYLADAARGIVPRVAR